MRAGRKPPPRRKPAPKVRGFVPTPRRAQEIAKVVRALRLTPAEDAALERVVKARGVPWYDVVRGWIEMADGGVLRAGPLPKIGETPRLSLADLRGIVDDAIIDDDLEQLEQLLGRLENTTRTRRRVIEVAIADVRRKQWTTGTAPVRAHKPARLEAPPALDDDADDTRGTILAYVEASPGDLDCEALLEAVAGGDLEERQRVRRALAALVRTGDLGDRKLVTRRETRAWHATGAGREALVSTAPPVNDAAEELAQIAGPQPRGKGLPIYGRTASAAGEPGGCVIADTCEELRQIARFVRERGAKLRGEDTVTAYNRRRTLFRKLAKTIESWKASASAVAEACIYLRGIRPGAKVSTVAYSLLQDCVRGIEAGRHRGEPEAEAPPVEAPAAELLAAPHELEEGAAEQRRIVLEACRGSRWLSGAEIAEATGLDFVAVEVAAGTLWRAGTIDSQEPDFETLLPRTWRAPDPRLVALLTGRNEPRPSRWTEEQTRKLTSAQVSGLLYFAQAILPDSERPRPGAPLPTKSTRAVLFGLELLDGSTSSANLTLDGAQALELLGHPGLAYRVRNALEPAPSAQAPLKLATLEEEPSPDPLCLNCGWTGEGPSDVQVQEEPGLDPVQQEIPA